MSSERRALLFALACVAPLAACSGSSSPGGPPPDGGTPADGAQPPPDASGVACAGPCPASSIRYLVVVVMENHTFDTHFGAYCTAAAGSNPTCNAGPACCEGAPAKDPSGASPMTLDDTENGTVDPNHGATCEVAEMDNGAMDKYVAGAVNCSSPHNWVQASPTIVKPYWDLAKANALADRFFQPVVGPSAANDMYLARAGFVFPDNVSPQGAVGATCGGLTAPEAPHTEKTIGDLLNAASVPWTFYAEGYDAQVAAAHVDGGTGCATADPACPAGMDSYPCTFDPGDDPFEFYSSLQDKAPYIQDMSKLASALSSKSLPAVSFVKPIGYKTEHPGSSDTLSAGPAFVTSIVSQIQASAYAASTLVLVAWDESGGYFDHVAPPATNPSDNKAYGPRIPLIAVGPFTKKNYVSHVTMEHSSIVKFIEWNWLGMQTGQLQTRDTNVNNIGDLLDPAATGATVPAN
jgi:phospholipase C